MGIIDDEKYKRFTLPDLPEDVKKELPGAMEKTENSKGTYLRWGIKILIANISILMFATLWLARDIVRLRNENKENELEKIQLQKELYERLIKEIKPDINQMKQQVTETSNKMDTAAAAIEKVTNTLNKNDKK